MELREFLADIDAVSPEHAAKLIQERRAETEAEIRARAERQEQLHSPDTDRVRPQDRDGGRGLGR